MERSKLSKKINTLEFLFELGATEAHESKPLNRFSLSDNQQKPNLLDCLHEEKDKSPSSLGSNPSINKFTELINCATTVNELESVCVHYKDFSSSQLSDKCNFAFGSSLAEVMVICEPPGRMEIREKIIYSGDRGLIFQKMYEAIGLSFKRNNLYAIPIFPWRLSPNPDSAENDIRQFFCCVKKHVSIVKPKVLISMVKDFDNFVEYSFGNETVNDEYEFQKDLKKFTIETPARLLQAPNEKRAAWETLKQIKNFLGKNYE